MLLISFMIRSFYMAQKLPRCWGGPAVSHWHYPQGGSPWPQSGPDCPKLRSVYIPQHLQQWTLCSCGIWWHWWPLRWVKVCLYLCLLVTWAVVTSVLHYYLKKNHYTNRNVNKQQCLGKDKSSDITWPMSTLNGYWLLCNYCQSSQFIYNLSSDMFVSHMQWKSVLKVDSQ